jgi:hypothetical protein
MRKIVRDGPLLSRFIHFAPNGAPGQPHDRPRLAAMSPVHPGGRAWDGPWGRNMRGWETDDTPLPSGRRLPVIPQPQERVKTWSELAARQGMADVETAYANS